MSLPRSPHAKDARHTAGVALVIVLAFVVLLTGLMVAFFSRAAATRQLSNSSAEQSRVAQLAKSATDNIVAGFKSEIVAGSMPTPNPAPSYRCYVPATAANAVPVRYGDPNSIANLVRESRSGDAGIPAPAVPSSASAVNSTTDKAVGGRNVTLARWNSHYLVPRFNAPANAPSTPDAFSAPDWVLVNRAGPAVVPNNAASFGSTTANTVNNSTATNQNYVVGRYAYAVYDEGGLLDMNVAGYPVLPAPTPAPAQTGLTSTQVSSKSSVALADLKQLPIVKTPSSPDPTANPDQYLSASDVNGIIGWRNYAAAGMSGSYPISSFTTDQANNWFTHFAKNNTTGFLTAYGGPQGNTDKTDQAFLSRQQLLKLQSSLGFSANALQYMGTFSRALEQPSFQPDPNRPKITPTSAPTNDASSYQGNNTYAGHDADINFVGVSGGLLSVRVGASFKRLDGSMSVVGEPLLKRRFALSRLLLVTSSATANKVAGDPIWDRFGLYRSDISSPWVYNHGMSQIMTLTQVAAQNREPDMAELLKAAINVGSVGKATYTNQGRDLEYIYDVDGDRQILQIMANLIDQTKSDNYPTQIKPFSNTATALTICGVQDLPYFYNWHYLNLTTATPSPLLIKTDVATFQANKPPPDNSIAIFSGDHMKAVPLGDPGAASCMIIPQIWNPHDANTLPASGGGPTQFRVVAETTDPTGTLGYWLTRASPSMNGEAFDGVGANNSATDPPDSVKSAYTALTMPPTGTDFSDSALMFTDGTGGKAFREPTLLWRDNFPTGVRLSGTYRTEASQLTGNKYYGILIGDTKVSWACTASNPPDPNGNSTGSTSYVCQSSTMHRGITQNGPSACINDNYTFRMQYKDQSGKWVTYQNAFVEANLLDYPGWTLFVNPSEPAYDAQQYKNPMQIGVNAAGSPLSAVRGGPYDPRTPRFASPVQGYWNNDDPDLNGNPTLDAVTMNKNVNNSGTNKFTVGQNQAVATSNFVLVATQRPAASRGQYYNYTNPGYDRPAQMRWYSAANPSYGNFFGGLLSQNNPAVLFNAFDNNNNAVQIRNYYEDADHICRRAMGAYVKLKTSAPASGSYLTSADSTIGLPLATAANQFSGGVGTTTSQSQSRPIILHRPFTSVAEMAMASRGGPWKHIDFFTPESGDTALLDVFCVNEPPVDAIIAGKVNLNTQQLPVLQAILAGAYRDELTANMLPALSNTEAANVASVLTDITSNPTNKAWRGPLTNVADLVGHFVPNAGAVRGDDVYQYTSNGGGTPYTYAGFSAALSGKTPSGNNIWDSPSANSTRSESTVAIQRFHEAAIRPLASCGQTRIWNLLIDVVAQSGHYPPNSTALSQFSVDGEVRYWVHVAIDRSTGQVIDKQTEIVTE